MILQMINWEEVVLERQIPESFPYKSLASIKERLEILVNRPQLESVSSIYKALELLEEITFHYGVLQGGDLKGGKLIMRSINFLFLRFCFSRFIEIHTLVISVRKEVRFLPVYYNLLKDIKCTKAKIKRLKNSYLPYF
jgi:hypothetical protein